MRITFLALLFPLVLMYESALCQDDEPDYIIASLDKLSQMTKDDTNKVNQLLEISYYYSETNPYKGIEYAKLSIDLSNQLNFKSGLAASYNNLGNCYYVLSDFGSALKYYQKSAKINNSIGNKSEESIAYTNMGYQYYLQSDFQNALESFFKSLELNELINKKNGISIDYGNIGSVYLVQQDFKKALQYFNKSLKLAQELNLPDLISNSLGSMGNAYFEIKDYNKSLDYYQKSIEIARELDNTMSVSQSLANMGMIYLRTGNYDQSLANLTEALKLQELIKFDNGLMISYGNLGGLFLKLADTSIVGIAILDSFQLKSKNDFYKKSLEYSLKAITISNKLNSGKELIEWYENTSNAYQKMGIWDSAFTYLLLSHKMKDSVFSQENKNKIARLELNREKVLLLKENEYQKLKSILIIVAFILILIIATIIFLSSRKIRRDNNLLNETNLRLENANIELELQNQIISESKIELEQLNDDLLTREQQLSQLNATKDKFFSIIAHDLKNPISALITGSDLLFNYYDRMNDPDRLKHIGNLSESSRFLFKLLENLLQWSRSQTGNIDFYPQNELIDHVIIENINLIKLNANSKGIEILYNTEQPIIANFDKNMINAVLRNLLSNAVKFSKSGDKIIINKFVDNRNLYVEVIDTGTGISVQNLDKLFRIDKSITLPGTNNEKGTGLGLLICREFVEKHNGKISVESNLGKGSKFTFSIPI